MNKISSFSYFLRKSPVVRTGGWICAALLFVIVSVIFGMRIQQKPEIESIVPPVGSPGDLIIILLGWNKGVPSSLLIPYLGNC